MVLGHKVTIMLPYTREIEKGLHTEAAFKRGLRENNELQNWSRNGSEKQGQVKKQYKPLADLRDRPRPIQIFQFIFNKVNCICLYISEYHKSHTSIIWILKLISYVEVISYINKNTTCNYGLPTTVYISQAKVWILALPQRILKSLLCDYHSWVYFKSM